MSNQHTISIEMLVDALIAHNVSPAASIFAVKLYKIRDEENFLLLAPEACEAIAGRCSKTVRKYFSELVDAQILTVCFVGDVVEIQFVAAAADSPEQKRSADSSPTVGTPEKSVQKKISSCNCIVSKENTKVKKNTDTVAEKIFDLIFPMLIKRMNYLREKSKDHSPFVADAVRYAFAKRIESGELTAGDVINIFLALQEKGSIKKTAMALVHDAVKRVYKPFGFGYQPVKENIDALVAQGEDMAKHPLLELLARVGLMELVGKDAIKKWVESLWHKASEAFAPKNNPLECPTSVQNSSIIQSHTSSDFRSMTPPQLSPSARFASHLLPPNSVSQTDGKTTLTLPTSSVLGARYGYNKQQTLEALFELFGANLEVIVV